MSLAKLKPCPFCRQQPSHVECMDFGDFAVICYCGAQGPSVEDAEAHTEITRRVHNKAAKAWNTRPRRALNGEKT